MTPGKVALLRRVYKDIVRSPIPDDAPLETQHAYWRLHDHAKREYAVADWKWESLILRALIVSAGVALVASFIVPAFLTLAVGLCVLALWRCYVIFTRHAPD